MSKIIACTAAECPAHDDLLFATDIDGGRIRLAWVPGEGVWRESHVPGDFANEAQTVYATNQVAHEVEAAGVDGCDPRDYVTVLIGRPQDTVAGRADQRILLTPDEGLLLRALLRAERALPRLPIAYVTGEVTGRVEIVSEEDALDEEGRVRADVVELDAEAAWAWSRERHTAQNDYRVRAGRLALAVLAGE